MAEPLFVVVATNDQPHPRWGMDKGGPLVLEQYAKDCATREQACQRAADWERAGYGKSRIARLIFEDEQPTTGATPQCP